MALVGQICAGIDVAKAQRLLSGLSAQSIEEQNGSFKPGARLSKLNRLALLVVRKHVRGERANVQFNLKELAEKQVQLKLDMRTLRVEKQLKQYRESYARSIMK